MSLRIRRCLWLLPLAPLLLAGCGADPGVAFSPDGRQVVVAGGEGAKLCLAPGADGRFEYLPGTEGGRSPQWSRDGKQLLFGVGEDVAFYDVTEGRAQALAPDASPPYAWSADGRDFTGFHAPEEGAVELCWYRFPEGDVERRVRLPFATPSRDEPPLRLSESGDVALLGDSGEGRNVYTVESGRVRKITHTDDILALGLSPDRRSLVWLRRAPDGQPGAPALWLYDLEERTASRLPLSVRFAGPGAPEVVSASFSRSGGSLAVTATCAGRQAAYAGPVGGVLRAAWRSDPRPASADEDDGGGSLSLCWAPDSRRLAVWRTCDTSVIQLCDVEGGGGETLTLPPDHATD